MFDKDIFFARKLHQINPFLEFWSEIAQRFSILGLFSLLRIEYSKEKTF